MMKLGVYEHPKTGRYYLATGFARCANNEKEVVTDEGVVFLPNASEQDMVIYVSLATGKIFCRDVNEFTARFEFVGETL